MSRESRERYFTGNPQVDSILSRIADRLDILEGLRPDLTSGLYKLQDGKIVTTTTDVLSWIDQDVKTTASPTFAGATINNWEVETPIPVGGIYLSTTGTDPATELGYGTWTQVAKGEFLVGHP